MRSVSSCLLAFAFAFGFVIAAVAQQAKSSPLPWKHYAYPADGFSVSAPSAPDLRTDPQVPGVKSYVWELAPGIPFAIHSGVRHTCNEMLQHAKQELPSAAITMLSLSGYPGMESLVANQQEQRNELERVYCVKDKAYVLSAWYPLDQKRPAVVDRMFNSFHLVGK